MATKTKTDRAMLTLRLLPRRGRPAFTLVEMLVVMGIIAVLAALIVPSAASVINGSKLTQGSQIIVDQLGLARQSARSRNHAVEVRFYQYADPEVSTETPGNANSGRYRAMQSFERLESGAFAPLGNVQRLPVPIILDKGTNAANTTLSSILGSAAVSPAVPTLTTAQTVYIPRVGRQYNAVAFQFRPDGSTNLPSATWFLTAHNMHDGDALAAAPKNFFTIQIDASNGHTRTFRP